MHSHGISRAQADLCRISLKFARLDERSAMRLSSVGFILICLLVSSASPSVAQRIELPVDWNRILAGTLPGAAGP